MNDITPGQAQIKCLRCQQIMVHLGQLPLRSGGHSGGTNFWLGSLGELGEQMLHLDAYRCSNCGHLEFFDFDLSLPDS